MHLWLAPFTEGKSHFVCIDFKEVSTLAMIRIWVGWSLNALLFLKADFHSAENIARRAVARALIGGVYIHIFVLCPTDFF